MSALDPGQVLALTGLGALHGVNPAMGWLFAVGLGLQERSARAVWRALPPLALGHALSVAAMVTTVALLGVLLPAAPLRAGTGVLLVAFGLHRLVRGHRMPRYGGMKVGSRHLVVWSFLMATAHGAGLMVLPFAVATGQPVLAASHAAHAVPVAAATGTETLRAGVATGQAAAFAASLLHTVAYLAVAGLVAVIVYQRAGVHVLRTAWINLDVIWAGALIITGALVATRLL